MQPGKVYKIEVDRDEISRTLNELDEHIAQGMRIYARLENLIKQGTCVPKQGTQVPKG
jgi:hypothetical protein